MTRNFTQLNLNDSKQHHAPAGQLHVSESTLNLIRMFARTFNPNMVVS